MARHYLRQQKNAVALELRLRAATTGTVEASCAVCLTPRRCDFPDHVRSMMGRKGGSLMDRTQQMSRRQLLHWGSLASAGIALGGSTLLAAGGMGAPRAASAAALNTLTVGFGGEPPTLNPLFVTIAPATSFYYALWDAPVDVKFDRTGRLVGYEPVLFESWRVLENKLTWEFKLRQGLKFDNGEDWDAEAFAFSLDWMMKQKDAQTNVKLRLAPIYDSAKAVDKYTARIETKAPFVLTPYVFTEFRGVPPRYFQQVGPQKYGESPVGLGPCRFVEWRRNERIVLERNPRYWRGPVGFDRLMFRAFPEDATRVAALEAGEIDIATGVPPDSAKRLLARGFQTAWVPVGQGMQVTMKLTIPSPLTDVRVRKAMNFAIDKKEMINSVMGGYGRVLRAQLASPSAVGYNPNILPYPYDLAEAKRLLAEAGFGNGFRMDFVVGLGGYLNGQQAAEYLTGAYRKVGIDLNLQIMEWGAHITRIYSPQAPPVFYTGSNWYPVMDSLLTLAFFDSTFARKQYSDERFDRMLASARGEFDSKKRAALQQQMWAYLREQAVLVWLFESPEIFGLGKRLASFTPTPDSRIHLDSVRVKSG
jgi:peptide/nickel transport system substrate-binding protein